VKISGCPTVVDLKVFTGRPSELSEAVFERPDLSLRLRIVLGLGHQYAEPAYRFDLLRARRERPRSRAAAKQKEFAPSYA